MYVRMHGRAVARLADLMHDASPDRRSALDRGADCGRKFVGGRAAPDAGEKAAVQEPQPFEQVCVHFAARRWLEFVPGGDADVVIYWPHVRFASSGPLMLAELGGKSNCIGRAFMEMSSKETTWLHP